MASTYIHACRYGTLLSLHITKKLSYTLIKSSQIVCEMCQNNALNTFCNQCAGSLSYKFIEMKQLAFWNGLTS